MPLLPLQFKPGFVRDLTRYTNTNGWWDGDKVRFRLGLPEKIGGWVQLISTQFLGACRSLINWTVLSGQVYFGLGTSWKYYVTTGASYIDVTPLRLTTTLGADPFSVTNSSTTMTVTDVGNGSAVNDFVTFSGATTFAGLSSAQINANFQIVTIVDADHYTVTLPQAANATTTGGGGAVTADYEIHVGLNTTVGGLGWGAGTWGHDTWGSDASGGSIPIALRLWSAANFGQDVVTCPAGGSIYHWDATAPTTRMVALQDLPGASNVPTVATMVLVSAQEFHVVAFGCTPIGSSTQDPLQIRWSATQSLVNWTPAASNTAGGYRLSVGTQIVTALETLGQTLVWTDQAIYTMTWVGYPNVFNFTQIAVGTNIIAPNAAVSVNDIVIWMGTNQFYMYNGIVQPMPCPVADYVFTRVNTDQLEKIHGFTNSVFDEVGWLYPSTTDECDSYVIYNYKEQCWYYGSMNRTAWLDRGPTYYPNATDENGYLYAHEFGFDDGSTNPASPITAYIQSSPIELPPEGPGDHFMLIDRLIPDITFRNSSAESPSVTMNLEMMDYPGANYSQPYDSAVTQSATTPVEQFTEQCYVRLRGRSVLFTCTSDMLGVTWRLGTNRIGVRLDGRR